MFKNFINLFKPMQNAKTKIIDKGEIKKLYTIMRVKMFFSMYLGYVAYYFTRKNISPVLHIFSEELNLSIKDLGILSSTMYVTYGIGKFLSGLIADKTNIRAFMAFGLLGSSIINLFFAYLPSLYLLTFFWGLNGIFQSMGFPPVARGLVYWFSTKERASKWTLWSSSHTAGTFLVGLLIAFLLKTIGWKAAFYVPGIIGIAISIILFKTLVDKPENLGLPLIEEYKGEKPLKLLKNTMSHLELLKTYIFKNPFLWSLSIAYVFVYFVRFATLDWGTKFMYDERGIDKVATALLWSFMPLLGMPGGIVAGFIADKFFKGRCTPINVIYLILLSLSCLGFYYFASPDNLILSALLLAAIGFLVDGPQNLIGGVQASRVTVKEAVSSAVGFTGIFGYVGAFLSGIGSAIIINNWGWWGIYFACALSCIIAAILTLFTWKAEYKGTLN